MHIVIVIAVWALPLPLHQTSVTNSRQKMNFSVTYSSDSFISSGNLSKEHRKGKPVEPHDFFVWRLEIYSKR